MKRILFILTIVLLGNAVRAQYVYTIKADSVKITNTCDTAELIIENHTQTVPGFLFNKGRGRTEFRRGLVKMNDSAYVIGGDTLHMNPWLQGGNRFGVTGVLGTIDNNGVGFITNNTEKMRISANGKIGIGTSNPAYRLDIVDTPGFGGPIVNITTSADAFPRFQVTNTSTGAGAGAGMLMINNANQSFQYYMGGTNNAYVPSGALIRMTGTGGINIVNDNGPIAFGKDPHIGFNEFARFLNNGNMGIGTQIPQAKLHVNGTAYITDTLKLMNIISKVDTGNYKPVVVDAAGSVFKLNHWVGAAAIRKSATVTADSYTVPADVEVVFINYTGGTATISLPTGTLDREITIKNLNTTNSVALSGLDASESNTIATRGAITVKYTGSAWVGISKY